MARENIIIVYPDDVTAVTNHSTMPYLSSRPHGNWVGFYNSTIVSPVCTPSRVALLTGLYGQRSRVTSNWVVPFQDHTRTLGPILRRCGYTTGLFGKYLNWTPDPGEYSAGHAAQGWDDWRAFYGGNDYYGYTMSENGTPVEYGSAPEDFSTDVVMNHATNFVQTASEPFFAYVTPYSPHGDYSWAPRHDGQFTDYEPDWPPSALFWHEWNEGDPRTDKPQWLRDETPIAQSTLTTRAQKIARSMLSVDEGIESIINALAARGVLDNTIIVYATDNGNLNGEHGYSGKSCVYREALWAQMLARWPGAVQRDEQAMVANIDIAPTLTSVAGTRMPWACDGMDFGPVVRGEQSVFRDDLYISLGDQPAGGAPWDGIVTGAGAGQKYAEYQATGERERYDLSADPHETVNLAAGDGDDDGMAARLGVLRQEIQDKEPQ